MGRWTWTAFLVKCPRCGREKVFLGVVGTGVASCMTCRTVIVQLR